jgi:cytoskeletal protein CcmA (bactofilin family)
MFLKKPKLTEAAPPPTSDGWDTVLGAGCRIQGDVSIRGSLRVQGEIEGSVTVTGEIEIELGARVQGEIRAERARVAGRVEGDVRVREDLELRQGAHLRGDVHARSFRIQDGAIFQGNCHMGRDVEQPGSQSVAGKAGSP